MNCVECRELLAGYIEGLLDAQQKEAIVLHLAGCAACRTELEQAKNLQNHLVVEGRQGNRDDLETAVMNRIVREQAFKLRKVNQDKQHINFWRLIMRNKLAQLATAAVIAIAVVASLTFFNRSVSTAFAGIEQVIDAYNDVRFLQVRQVRDNQQESEEFWIKSDEQGRVAKARYYLPVTEDGIKVITWTPEKAEIWFKTKNAFLVCQTSRIEAWMQSIVEQCQPKLVMRKLLEDQKGLT
jgi:hypothetical protein